MLSPAPERQVQSSGALATASFAISQKHASHIMGILRSSMYSRPELAVLREYSTNAWDEHRQCGKADVPIQVTLPTFSEPTLRIRDFGRGMTPDEVLFLYTQYGESTKRDVADVSGMLGIGCKAGFAYGDSFTITSWRDGMKSVYVAVLDKSNAGEMRKVYEGACDPSDTGIEVMVAVRPSDIDDFKREAEGLFQFFRPQPVINLKLPPLPEGENGFFVPGVKSYSRQQSWVAVMGCIPYRLDLNVMQQALSDANLLDVITRLSGGVYLPMGAVEFSASREELQYTDTTITAIVSALQLLVSEHIEKALAQLKGAAVNEWERRLSAVSLLNQMKFPVPKEFSHLAAEKVVLRLKGTEKEEGGGNEEEEGKGTPPRTFRLWDGDKYTTAIKVSTGTVLYLQTNSAQYLKGYDLGKAEYIVVPFKGAPVEDARTELLACLDAVGLTGIPLKTLEDSKTWEATVRASGKGGGPVNEKHKRSTFVLTQFRNWTDVRSDLWTSVDPPEGPHTFVILSAFRLIGADIGTINSDKQLVESLGGVFPPIYGYKTTSKLPVEPKDITNGVSYAKWRLPFLMSLYSEEFETEVACRDWAELFPDSKMGSGFNGKYNYQSNTYDPRFNEILPKFVQFLEERLGTNHPFPRYFQRYRVAASIQAVNASRLHAINDLLCILRGAIKKGDPTPSRIVPEDNPKKWLDAFHKAYPMLQMVTPEPHNMGRITRHPDVLVNYIQTLDAVNGAPSLVDVHDFTAFAARLAESNGETDEKDEPDPMDCEEEDEGDEDEGEMEDLQTSVLEGGDEDELEEDCVP